MKRIAIATIILALACKVEKTGKDTYKVVAPTPQAKAAGEKAKEEAKKLGEKLKEETSKVKENVSKEVSEHKGTSETTETTATTSTEKTETGTKTETRAHVKRGH